MIMIPRDLSGFEGGKHGTPTALLADCQDVGANRDELLFVVSACSSCQTSPEKLRVILLVHLPASSTEGVPFIWLPSFSMCCYSIVGKGCLANANKKKKRQK
jgi:hypothetical protein